MGLPLVHFYHFGMMFGVDLHKYAMRGEVVVKLPHAAMGNISDGDKPVPTVTNGGFKMHWQDSAIRGPADLLHIPPAMFPPGATEVFWYADTQIFGSSAFWMCVSSVTSIKTPLACCVNFMIGINNNCGDSPITNMVWVRNTVITRPSIYDYALWVLRVIANFYLQQLMDLLPKAISDKLKNKIPDRFKSMAEQAVKRAARQVGRAIGDPAKEIQKRLRSMGSPL